MNSRDSSSPVDEIKDPPAPAKKAKTRMNEEEEKDKPPKPELITGSIGYDIASVLAPYLGERDIAHLLTSCRGSKDLFCERRLPQLLNAVVQGDFKKAEQLVKVYPRLLVKPGTVTDYSGRTYFNVTAYELASGACDYSVRDEKGNIIIDGMVEMLEQHLSQLPKRTREENQLLIQTLYEKQFPKGSDVNEAKRVESDSKAIRAVMEIIEITTEKNCALLLTIEKKIHKIVSEKKPPDLAAELQEKIQSVKKADADETFEASFLELIRYLKEHALIEEGSPIISTFKALYKFRNHLESKNVHLSGKHFNYQLLIDAVQLYNQNRERMKHPDQSAQNKLCWQKIMGYVLTFLPACDAQILAQGCDNILKYNKKGERSLIMQFSRGSYYPIGVDPEWHMGENCSIRPMRATLDPDGSSYNLAPFIQLAEKKQAVFKAYTASKQSPSPLAEKKEPEQHYYPAPRV